MNKFKTFLLKLKKTPIWLRILIYLLTILCGVFSLIIATSLDGEPLPFISYPLFILSAILLTYTVLLAVWYIPKIKNTLVAWAEKREFTNLFMKNFGFRTLITSCVSLFFSLAFSVFNGYLGISLLSIWYGALSAYYLFITIFRTSILIHYAKRPENLKNTPCHKKKLSKAKLYRNCGILILTLNVALSSAIAQMIFNDASFSYPDWTIFAYAAYAFYKITMSIINIIKANKQEDLTVQAVRNVNLTDACVSILALQTALLHAFSQPNLDISIFNTITGIMVTAITVTIGVLMIIKANKHIKNIPTEK